MSSARPSITRPSIALLLLLIVCLFASLTGLQPARAQSSEDQAVLLSATVTDPTMTGQLKITLNFPADGRATGYTISRKKVTDAAFRQIGTISAAAAPTAISYVDPTVTEGVPYEYQVIKNSNVTAYGYVVSGIHVPLPSIPANANADGSRGTLILVYANDTAADPRIAAGLTRLTQDLIGDGWAVIPHSVNRDAGMNTAGVMNDHGDAVRAVKALIRADYTADPVNVKAVLLFGHVPVPYSGDIAPDGHTTHNGAWPADVYYGDMGPETYWTDNSVNDTTADNPRTYNVPGDGKFDESSIPSTVALEVGRVDLADMGAFAPKSEADLLAQYLNKDHNYRSGFLNLNPVGRITDNFGYFNGEAFAANGYRNFAPFFGASAVTTSGGGNQIFPDLDLGNFQWTYGCGPGGPTGAGGVGSTTDFAQNDPHSTFYMLFGSFFGDWGYGFSSPDVPGGGNDFLRAPLATTTYGLTDCWGGRPNWFYQHMGLGSEIGYSARLTQTNTGTYQPGGGAEIHVALMGDPTLRLHVVMPASGLTAVTSAADVLVSWTASNQALNVPLSGVNSQQPNVIAGYNVYRQDSPTGPFTLLNTGGLVTGTTYTDMGAGAAAHTYQVRAVALQDSPSGTYYNQSQGVFQAFDPAHAAPTLTLVSPTKAAVTGIGHPEADAASTAPGVAFYVNAASGNPTVTLTIAAQATSSIPNDPGLTVTFYVGSVLLGTATAAPYQLPVTLAAGTYQISAVATDGQGATVASNELPVYVFKDGRSTSPVQDGDLVIYGNGKLGNGWSDISNKNNNAMSDNLSGTASVNLNVPGSALVLSHVPIDSSLYPDLILHLVLTGNTDGGKPGGQQITISAPLQDTAKPIAVTLPGFNNYTDPNTYTVIPIGGLAGAGERTRNMDGVVIRDSHNNIDPVTGNVVATPTFYIQSIYLTADGLRSNRAAGVAIHLDQAKFAFASQATVPIVAKGDAATSDGSVVEVDLFLNGAYIGRGGGQGSAAQPYSPYSFTLPSLAAGSYTLTANAVTSFGTISSSTAFTFVVVAPPTVAITAPANNTAAATGRPLTVSATAAAGAGGSLVNVQFFETPTGGPTTEIGPDQTGPGPYTVQFTPPSAGTYTLTVIATDDAGGTTTSAPITVNVGDPPTVSLTSPANGATYVAPASIPLAATATAGSNPITQVQFFSNGVAVGPPITAAPYTFTQTGVPAGTYVLTAVATDSIGLSTSSATATPVTVVVNTPPSVVITAPTDGAAFTTPATFSITATPTAGSNPITQVQFFSNGVALGAPVAAPGPYTVSDANVPAGTYALTAVVTDSAGLSATSPTVTATVSTPPTVSITAPANGTILAASRPFSITASVTAGTNPVAQVQFLVNNAPVGAPVTAAPYTFTDPGLPAGTYTLTATATDSTGLAATSAPITVTVDAPPAITITAPANNAALVAPATFSITASATAGTNPITQVQFFANGVAVGAPIAAPGPYTVSDANVPVGTYILTAVATDSVGLTTTSAPITVTVSTLPTIAITAPANGTTYVAPATINVTATVTQGTNPITQVQFFANGVAVGSAATAPYTFTGANVPAGSYAFTAVATDSKGLTATSAPINVVVNAPPTVSITAPANGAVFAAPATISITASPKAGTNPITQVQFFAGTTLIGTATAAPYTVSFANVPVGSYALTAVATDSAGLSATSPVVNVTVATAPSVAITAPANGATAVSPGTFTLTAAPTAGSSPIVKVDFFANGKAIGTATASPYTVSFANVAAGTYALTAVATDSAGLTATSPTVTVTVNTPPMVSITAPTGGTVYTSPATFNVTATPTAGSSPIVKVDFFANGKAIGTATASPYTVSFANVAAGTYALTAVATDSAGLTATSAAVTVVVNASPTVSITSPANGANFIAPTLIPITASATAGSNPIAKVDFFANGQAIGTALAAPYTVNFNGATAGTYVLTARATDTAGQTTTSAAVTITVSAPPSVTITTPANNASFSAPATIPITAGVTVGSSPIAKVDFFANGKLIGTATAAPYTISFANVAPGAYSLTAVATDTAGLTATSPAVSITVVVPQPVFGLVSRSTDNSAVLAATVTFTNQTTGQVTTVTTGQAATGPDGKPADYSLTSLAPGAYVVSVSAPGYVAPASQTVRVTLGQALRVDFTFSPLHAFPTGLQMFSVPYDYSASGQSLAAILGIPSPRLVDWDPATMSYTVPSTFVLGMGYWANFPAGTGLVLQGVPAPTNHAFSKTLATGWNIIGDPFLTSAPWSSVQIVGANGTGQTLAAAAGQHLIGANLYTYDQNTRAYDTLPVAGGAGSLDPYVGYWIYAAAPETLVVSPPGQ